MVSYLKDDNYRDMCESIGQVHDLRKMSKMTKRRNTLMKNHEELVQMRKIIRGLESTKKDDVLIKTLDSPIPNQTKESIKVDQGVVTKKLAKSVSLQSIAT